MELKERFEPNKPKFNKFDCFKFAINALMISSESTRPFNDSILRLVRCFTDSITLFGSKLWQLSSSKYSMFFVFLPKNLILFKCFWPLKSRYTRFVDLANPLNKATELQSSSTFLIEKYVKCDEWFMMFASGSLSIHGIIHSSIGMTLHKLLLLHNTFHFLQTLANEVIISSTEMYSKIHKRISSGSTT